MKTFKRLSTIMFLSFYASTVVIANYQEQSLLRSRDDIYNHNQTLKIHQVYAFNRRTLSPRDTVKNGFRYTWIKSELPFKSPDFLNFIIFKAQYMNKICQRLLEMIMHSNMRYYRSKSDRPKAEHFELKHRYSNHDGNERSVTIFLEILDVTDEQRFDEQFFRLMINTAYDAIANIWDEKGRFRHHDFTISLDNYPREVLATLYFGFSEPLPTF